MILAAVPSRNAVPVKIATVCTVFVESDILSYLSQGKNPEDIMGGVHLAIAERDIATGAAHEH